MTLSRRVAVGAVSLALAAGGTPPALALASSSNSMMSKWTQTACKAYWKKWEHVSKSKAKSYNKVLKEHSCSEKVS